MLSINHVGKTLRTMLPLLILCMLVTSAVAEEPSTKGQAARSKEYRPDVVYQGEYLPASLYYRHRSTQQWMRAGKVENYSELVKACAVAKARLASEGRWLGNFAADGSCGAEAEPATYILGNRLNYEEALNN